MTPPNTPPLWPRKLLGRLLEPRLLEACLGDLEEKFHSRLDLGTPAWKAKLSYSLEALGFIKLTTSKNQTSDQTTINMIGHTMLFFSRLVRKDKSYYLVSLFGLTLSLSSFMLIMLFVNDELSYDQFLENRERIFRVTTHLKVNDVAYHEATSQFPLAAALVSELEEVESTVRLFPQDAVFEFGDKKFTEHAVFADSKFFTTFSFPLVYGDPATVLSRPESVVLTQASAKKYFGPENPLGKMIQVYGQLLAVTGVAQDVPEQSHLKFDAILPMALQLNYWKSQTGIEGRENKWFWTGAYTYVLLKDGRDKEKAKEKLPIVINKYFPERFKAGGRYELQPVTDIHLKSALEAELEPGGSILYVRLFSVVALMIMVVSSINLVNLTYFKISSRIREMGIRKFLGQNTRRIITQFSLESVFLGLLAFVLALIVSRLFLSGFNLLVQKNLTLWSAKSIALAGGTLGLIIAICLGAVVRPSFRYAVRSSNYLLLQKYRNPGNSRMRNMLIGLQVGFSFILLVFAFIISSQISFFRNKDLGFDKENIVVVNMKPEVHRNLEAFINELRKNKDVQQVTASGVPLDYDAWRFVPEGGSHEKPLMLPFAFCDYNFLKTLNIHLLKGENFDPNNRYDSLAPFLINKRAAMEMGWQDDPIGKRLEVFAPGTTEIMLHGKVIGLIQDYHFESLHKSIKPVILTVTNYPTTVLVRISGPNHPSALAGIEKVWKKFSAEPLEYEFLDKKLEMLYDNETQLSNVILFFTGITLYLSCYGLFAMSSLLFGSKLKEVAIRKVFGATRFSIIRQLYAQYAFFNLAAMLLGLPVAIYVGQLWLETFEYRIGLTSELFLKAGVCILLAGLTSVSFYLYRVAFSNPVAFLRRD